MKNVRLATGLMLACASFFCSVFFSLGALAVSQAESAEMIRHLDLTFRAEIQRLGYSSVELRPEATVPDYVGGVDVTGGRIQIVVGTQMLSDSSASVLQFLFCHELGHILGGTPYKTKKLGRKYEHVLLSVEGQADYWAGLSCLSSFTDQPLESAFDFFSTLSRMVQSWTGESSFYQFSRDAEEIHTYYDSEYPSFQCRFNSAVAGIRHESRPTCWFPR